MADDAGSPVTGPTTVDGDGDGDGDDDDDDGESWVPNATVERVVDGDTIVAEIGTRSESVRLIGIDTPESVARTRPVQCYGKEASLYLETLLPVGTAVTLVRDVEARDVYDRLLGYVVRSSDGLFVNLELVAAGYASVLNYPPNDYYAAVFARAESEADSGRTGVMDRVRRPRRAAGVTRLTDSPSPAAVRYRQGVESLVERLGYPVDARLVIVSADRIGTTHSSTAGGYRALREGAATTGTIVMPGVWARHAAELYRGEDLGVHLTLNSELDCFRWGPITTAPSLLDGDGGFPRTLHDLWDHADLDEVRKECRAQLERAVLWGFDVTHLTTHMAALQQRPEFFDVLLDLAVGFDLPLRLEGAEAESNAGFPFRSLAVAEGIVFPDHFRLVRGDARRHVAERLADLPAGVTELSLCPALDEPEIHAVDPTAAGRVDDLALALSAETLQMIEAADATAIGYRALRSVQRRAHNRS